MRAKEKKIMNFAWRHTHQAKCYCVCVSVYAILKWSMSSVIIVSCILFLSFIYMLAINQRAMRLLESEHENINANATACVVLYEQNISKNRRRCGVILSFSFSSRERKKTTEIIMCESFCLLEQKKSDNFVPEGRATQFHHVKLQEPQNERS